MGGGGKFVFSPRGVKHYKMELEPKDLYEKLEFNKVIELLEEACLGEQGREAVHQIVPLDDRLAIERLLEEVKEYKLTIEQNDPFPIKTYFEITEDLRMLEIVDFVLPEEGFRRINIVLLFVRDMVRFFNAARRLIYPALYDIIRPVPFDESLLEAIERVIDEDGNIRPDASPKLLKIRKSIQARQKELDKVFRMLANEYRNKGMLSDNVESFRNGRRVLSVPSEHKRKIRGIIHDESTTGKTAFIEPEPVIEINNDIFDLETEERREIYRILKELSTTVRPYVPVMRDYQELIIRFDLVHAKARLAVRMNANLPRLVKRLVISVQDAYHPLLYLKNKQSDKTTVPFTLTLSQNNRILILSGPNAGGKSVTMKSVGLLQLMLQCGLLIPVSQESEMGVFSKFFADIGDQQSLEDDLSTYSSRLANARLFLENADDRTLVLIDEFGSGTDPKIGGAIAEGVLRELNFRKVFGVITTHYSNLKVFAFKTKGLVNGSMFFDKDHLLPTYELKVGRPGSSYAFEIAEKIGLDDRVMQYARQKIGQNEKAVDELLVDLQREKQESEELLKELTQKQQQLDKLIRNYEQLHLDLEFRRKKVKLETKEKDFEQTAQQNKDFERIIREIKEAQNLEKAKELAMKAKESRRQIEEEIVQIKEEIYQPIRSNKKAEVKIGDYVKLRSGGATGLVEAIEKGKAIVLMGQMRMKINSADLLQANEPLDVQSHRSVQTDAVQQAAAFQPKIDVRGMRMEEAMKMVEEFVDRAIVNGSAELRIVHGKGDGILRKVVRQKIREYNMPVEISHPPAEDGGDGVTIVKI